MMWLKRALSCYSDARAQFRDIALVMTAKPLLEIRTLAVAYFLNVGVLHLFVQ